MDPAFDPPKGDAADLQSAITKLQGLAKGLATDKRGVTTAVQTAVGQWNGPRKRDFERAGAGLELKADEAAIAVGEIADALRGFHTTLTSTTSEISGYRKRAAELEKTMASSGTGPHAVNPDAGRSLNQLITQANNAKDDLARKARTVSSRIDGITGSLVKSPSKLSPAELARKVHHADGVGSYDRHTKLTSKQAWGAVQADIDAVPEKAVRSDGTIDWEAMLGNVSTGATLATAPPAIWAMGNLLKYARNGKHVASDIRQIFSDTVGRTGLAYDRGEATLEDLALAYKSKFSGLRDMYMAFRSGERNAAVAAVKDGGLTRTLRALKVPGETAGKIARVAGPGLGLLGMAADVDTFFHPGTHAEGYSTGEIELNKWGSAANFAGTAAVLAEPVLTAGAEFTGLATVNAAADWIPGVGEVVMVGTGLYLAGDYLYHNWKPFKHVVDSTVDGVKNVAKSGWNGAKSAWHAVTPW